MADVTYRDQFLVLGGIDTTSFAVDDVEAVIPVGPLDGIAEDGRAMPEYSLRQNFPNPFNPATAIQFSIPTSQQVMLKVYDVLGREVATLVNEQRPAGTYTEHFDAGGLSSGVYFCRLVTATFSAARTLALMK